MNEIPAGIILLIIMKFMFQGITGATIIPLSDIVRASTSGAMPNSSYFSLSRDPGSTIPTVWSQVSTVSPVLMSAVLVISSEGVLMFFTKFPIM